MDVDAHAVTQTMVVVIAIAGIADDLLGKPENIVALDARMDGGDALLVRTAHERVQIELLLRGFAHHDGARHVGTIIAVARAVIHKDEVALLDHAITRDGMRVGGVGAACHDGAEGQAVGAVSEHKVLELVANLLLGHAGLNKAEHVLEGGVGDRLRMAHEIDLLGVLDGAHPANVVMHQRQHAGDGSVLQATLNALVEINLHVVLDGTDTALVSSDLAGDPAGDGALVHVIDPGAAGGRVLLKAVEIARVGMEQAAVGRNKRGVRELEGVVEDALHTREPTKVGLVAHYDGVVAALDHQGTNTLDTTDGTGSKLRHADSSLVVLNKSGTGLKRITRSQAIRNRLKTRPST